MSNAEISPSTSKKENDHVIDEISIKEENIDGIKEEDVDELDLDTVPASDIQLNVKKEIEEFPNDHFLIDPKDIPGIEKIVNIEDILKNNYCNTDSSYSLSSENTDNALQSNKTSVSKSLSVPRNRPSQCNCMQHFKHYCISCNTEIIYKSDRTDCPVCKTTLKLRCLKCGKKFKILSSTDQLQNSSHWNFLSNEKKEIKSEKKVKFSCSVCQFKTENKKKIEQHVKTHHAVAAKVKKNEYSKVNKEECYSDDDFIEVHCPKCLDSKNLVFDKPVKHVCEICQQVKFYRCVFCKKSYKALGNLRPHLKSKCVKRIEHFKFHCDHCYFKTEDKSKLELHIKLVHIPVTCEYCKGEFANSGAIKQHKTKGCPVEKQKKRAEMYEVKTQNLKPESTTQLPSTTSMQEEVSYQIVQYHPDEIYNEISSRPLKDLYNSSWQSMIYYYCLLCDGQPNKKISKYKPWCKTCNIKYEYKCKMCEKIYEGYCGIYKHVKSECPTRYGLLCTMCNFISTQKPVLISHIKNKHTVFKCLQCESRYHGYLSLRKHLLSDCKIKSLYSEKHTQKLIALYCKQCCKRMINFEGSSLKPCISCKSFMSYQCLKCNHLFEDLKMAQKHVKHECNPQFSCIKCSFNAYTQHGLNAHIKSIHSKKKCPDCGVEFRDEQIFKIHRLEELKRKEKRKKHLSQQEAKRIKLS